MDNPFFQEVEFYDRHQEFNFFSHQITMFSLRQYLLSAEEPDDLFRTLDKIKFERNSRGELCYSVGNAAVTFRVLIAGERRALRCYFHPSPRLKRIYQTEYLEREFFIHDTPPHGRGGDVVLTRWVEGEELGSIISRAAKAGDKALLASLSKRFDQLGRDLLDAPWAHGDLKPENIILDTEGELQLIDRDAMFLPEMQGELATELGTAAYQHSARTTEDFDATIDDFSVALISTALYALSLDPTLYERFGGRDGLLIDAQHPTADEALQAILACFAHRGEAVRYRIARTLLRRRPGTLPCREWMHLLGKPFAAADGQIPELYFSNEGLWGFRTDDKVVIPPLYDGGYDFTEGVAAVRLAKTWHFINLRGEVVLSCPPCVDVKPFREGRATLYTEQECYEIDIRGQRL